MNPKISTWKQFAKEVRSSKQDLLSELDNFPNSVLITGCQRSGTTILSRIITQSDGMIDYWLGIDDELDAALILSGYVKHNPSGRYCFQTTYLNECYREYFDHIEGHKIIWVLRNPYSVVYSLMYNWKRFARNELFDACGAAYLEGNEKKRYEILGHWGIGKLQKACFSYVGKVSQLFELKEAPSDLDLKVINYDSLVQTKETVLPSIYDFIDLPYREEYSLKLHGNSVEKADLLSKKERTFIANICMPTYEKALALC